MIVICQNDFPIGVLPGATEEQAEAFIKKMRADSDAAITDPHQARPAFHWHDVPEMKEGWYGRSAPVGAAEDMVLDAIERHESSAPVGVEASYHPCTSVLIEGLKRLEGGSDVLAEWDRARAKADAALAQQPAAVDEVHKAIRKVRNIATGAAEHPAQGPKHADGMRRACNIIEAALAQQPGKRYIDADIALAILREALAQQFIAAAAKDAEAEARAKRLVEALRNSADALERLAFAIRAPNAHTPQLVELAIAMRTAALAQQPAAGEQLTYKGVPIGPMQTFADMERQASAPVGVEDSPIDASDNAEYIERCADRLERCGLRVTAGALRVIAHEHRALAQRPAAVDEAMVDRAFAFCGHDPLTREDVHKMLTAALATQHQELKL